VEQPLPDTLAFRVGAMRLQQQIVETVVDALTRRGKRGSSQGAALLAQLNGVLEQPEQRGNERPHRLPGQFVAQLGEFAEQVDQAPLLGASQAVVGCVKITDQGAGKRVPQHAEDHIAIAMAVDEEEGQARIAETPSPSRLAVDAPAGLIALDHRRLPQEFEEFVDHGSEERAAPAEMAEQAGPANRQAKEVVQQVPGLAQGNAQVRSAVAGEQTCPRADVGAGQFEVAAALAGLLTAATVENVAAEAMPLNLRLGDIGNDVVLELTGCFEIGAAAMGALLGPDIVFEETVPGGGSGRNEPGCLRCFLRRWSERVGLAPWRAECARWLRWRLLCSSCSICASRRRSSAFSASNSTMRSKSC
jgi:hypothetical protein